MIIQGFVVKPKDQNPRPLLLVPNCDCLALDQFVWDYFRPARWIILKSIGRFPITAVRQPWTKEPYMLLITGSVSAAQKPREHGITDSASALSLLRIRRSRGCYDQNHGTFPSHFL